MEIDLSNVAPEDLQKVQKLLAEISQHQKYNARLSIFLDQAYEWQKKAIAYTKDKKVTGVICGNQMGKSEVVCAVIACHLTGIYPAWWKGHKFKQAPNVWIAGPDSRHNREVLQKRLFGTDNKRLKSEIGTGMIPRDAIDMASLVTIRGNEIESGKIQHISGGWSSFSFRAYTQGREAAQGAPVHFIAVDEQPNGEWWKEALTRTRATKGHAMLSFTPLKDAATSGNLMENLLDLPPEDGAPFDDFGSKWMCDEKWAMVRASWFDAPHILEAEPNAVEEAKREYSFDYQARVYGIPVVGSGRVYPHRMDDIIFNPEKTLINNEWDGLIGVDFGWAQNDPSAMIKCAWDEYNDVVYILEEWKGTTTTDQQFVKHLNFIDPNLPITWPRDGNSASDWKGGGTISDKLRTEFGLNMLPEPFHNPEKGNGKNNHLDPGFQEINSRLSSGRMKISSNCFELLKEIESYGYGKDINGQSTGKPAKYSNDHLCDAMRYVVMTIIQGKGASMRAHSSWDDDIDDDYVYQTY